MNNTKILQSKIFGAGNGAQTRDICLGKASLYQLSYSRKKLKHYYDNKYNKKSQQKLAINCKITYLHKLTINKKQYII